MIECESVRFEDVKIPVNHQIFHGSHNTPFGQCTVGFIKYEKEKLVCYLCFDDKKELVKPLSAKFVKAELIESPEESKKIIDKIFHKSQNSSKIKLLLSGTEFQNTVWETALAIPMGKFKYYDEIAKSINKPKAARAVGNALKANPINFLIPCHRVLSLKDKPDQKNGCARLKLKMQEYEKKIIK